MAVEPGTAGPKRCAPERRPRLQRHARNWRKASKDIPSINFCFIVNGTRFVHMQGNGTFRSLVISQSLSPTTLQMFGHILNYFSSIKMETRQLWPVFRRIHFRQRVSYGVIHSMIGRRTKTKTTRGG